MTICTHGVAGLRFGPQGLEVWYLVLGVWGFWFWLGFRDKGLGFRI